MTPKILRLYPLFLPILVLLLLATPAAAQGEGVIAGQVILGGADSIPPNLEAELLFLPNGQGPPAITPQPLDGAGRFRFEGIDPSPQHRYLVRVSYEGQEQYSELLAFESGETSKEVTLSVFGLTTDSSGLSVPQVSYLLDARAEGWVVAGLLRFQNPGERIIQNETAPPVIVQVPAEASSLQFSQEIPMEGIITRPDGFAYSGPFAPGDSSLIFSYLLPYEAGEQTITLPLGLSVQQVRVLIPDLGQEISTDLTPLGSQQAMGNQSYQVFEQQGVDPSQSFTFRFSGLPAAPPPEAAPPASDSTPLPDQPRVLPLSPLERLPWWAPFLPMGLAIIGVAGYLRARPAPSPIEQRATLRERRDTLVAEIAALDIRHEAGAIGEQTHTRQRALLKQELKEVLRHLGGT